MLNGAGIIFDTSWHYLDHLAPFCTLLQWPLLLRDPDLLEAARLYYPDSILLPTPSRGIDRWISSQFSALVSCAPKPLLEAAIGPTLPTHLWLPHGQSDKGQIAPYFKALEHDAFALIYGKQMQEVLQSHKLPLSTLRVGHFRNLYYQARRSFYDALPLGVQFRADQPMLLYAPTWQDAEENCSFWSAFPALAANLPPHINLLVKLHPNTLHQHRPEIERLIGQTERGNLQFLLSFFPILPLLERSSAYLGDRSSIGYDFLLFDRPLFFLDPHTSPKGRDLLSCGSIVTPQTLFRLDWEEERLRFAGERQRRAAYAFDMLSLKELCNSLKIAKNH